MLEQEIKTTFTCDGCGKAESHRATDKFIPKGWIMAPELRFNGVSIPIRVNGRHYCGAVCVTSALYCALRDWEDRQ